MPQENDILPGTGRITLHQGTQGPIKARHPFLVCSTSDICAFLDLLQHMVLNAHQAGRCRHWRTRFQD